MGQQRTIPIEGYAAKVNDRVIMVSDVMALVRGTEARLRSSFTGDELREALAEAYQDAVNSLIERELILEEYEEREGQIPEQAVEDHMSQVLAERFNNDRGALLKALQQEHLSYDEWREQIKEQLIISVMRRSAVIDKVSLSPNEAREVYETNIEDYRTPAQIKLRVITVSKGTTDEEQKTQAGLIKEAEARIKSGEEFSAVAAALSEGRKAKLGGDWGWIPSSDLREELAKVVRQLDMGRVSPIVAAGNNFYLLLVEGRKAETVIPLEEVREELEQELRRAEIMRIQDEWTQRLRNKHFVQVY